MAKVYSLEPDLNQWPMDICYCYKLQSTALPTELSRVQDTSLSKLKDYQSQSLCQDGRVV